jgi:hypothetical protein
MPIEIWQVLSDRDLRAQPEGEVLTLIAEVQTELQQSTPEELENEQNALWGSVGRPPTDDPRAQMPGIGNQSMQYGWLDQQLFTLARQFNDPWIPGWTQDLLGWNLTGVWALRTAEEYITYMRQLDHQLGQQRDHLYIEGWTIYMRQCGPYLNWMISVNNICMIFDPHDPKSFLKS